MNPIKKEYLEFLTQLATNNNKPWFEAHKTEFKAIETEVKTWFDEVKMLMNAHDVIEKVKVFRVYRDVRFSKDKTPYKSHFAGNWIRLGAERRGGYYLQIKPGASFLAAGFWQPEKDDLMRIRKELEMDAKEFKDLLADKKLKSIWGDLQGEGLKTAPKGFDKDHPDIEIIKKNQFIFVKNLKDSEVLHQDFGRHISEYFNILRPWLDYMSHVLTTNPNGESLLD